MSSLVGRKLGNYEVRALLGQGGMASVYLGYRADVDREVAIKVLPPHPGLSSDTKQRFQQEARTIANLQHPHILALYDYGATSDDILYLVMPYVRGGSLDKLMRQGRLPVARVERIMRELAGALDAAHKNGVVHRDIKPANILLDTEGNALLADFGIAKLTGMDTGLTGTGVVGTPAYMSPEQAQGFELSPRSDIYSLAVLVWEMLTGKGVFDTDNPMLVMMKHVSETPPKLSEKIPIAPAVDAVMTKALAKDPKQRYQTATAFYEAFAAAVKSGPATDPLTPQMDASTLKLPPTMMPQQGVTQYSNPQGTYTPPPQTIIVQQGGGRTTIVLVGALVVMLIALIVVVFALSAPPPPPPDVIATNIAGFSGATATPNADTITQTLVAQAKPTFGRLSFLSENALGDSVTLSLRDIRRPANNARYTAWLFNTRTGEALKLGTVAVDAVGSGVLSYIHPDGVFLPTLYNALLLTVEADPDAAVPAEVVYSGLLPIEMSDALVQIFIADEDGMRGRGLLETAMADARFATQHAGLAARSTSLAAMRTHNEHTLNILIGGNEDYDANGRATNPGTQIGLLVTLDNMNAALDAATSSPNATIALQSEAELIRVCIENVRLWSNLVIEAEQAMLTFEELEAAAEQMDISTQYADILNSGIDQNESGEVEPFEGECGLDQIGQYGLVAASMDVVEGGLEIR